MKEKVKADFQYAGQVGVRSFPTVVLRDGDQYYLIAQGYVKSKQIIEKCNQIISNKK